MNLCVCAQNKLRTNKDAFDATADGVLDTFAKLQVLHAFTLQVSEGNLWGQFELGQNAFVHLETGNGDVEVAINAVHPTLCPFKSVNQHNCFFLSHGLENSESACNLNISVEGQVILRDIALEHQTQSIELSEQILLHNETLDALAALGTAVRGTSYVVLTSGNPQRTAVLKPPSAVRYVILPSESFAGASMGVKGWQIWHCQRNLGSNLLTCGLVLLCDFGEC